MSVWLRGLAAADVEPQSHAEKVLQKHEEAVASLARTVTGVNSQLMSTEHRIEEVERRIVSMESKLPTAASARAVDRLVAAADRAVGLVRKRSSKTTKADIDKAQGPVLKAAADAEAKLRNLAKRTREVVGRAPKAERVDTAMAASALNVALKASETNHPHMAINMAAKAAATASDALKGVLGDLRKGGDAKVTAGRKASLKKSKEAPKPRRNAVSTGMARTATAAVEAVAEAVAVAAAERNALRPASKHKQRPKNAKKPKSKVPHSTLAPLSTMERMRSFVKGKSGGRYRNQEIANLPVFAATGVPYVTGRPSDLDKTWDWARESVASVDHAAKRVKVRLTLLLWSIGRVLLRKGA